MVAGKDADIVQDCKASTTGAHAKFGEYRRRFGKMVVTRGGDTSGGRGKRVGRVRRTVGM